MSDEVTEFPMKRNPLPDEAKWESQKARQARREFSATYSAFVRAMREAISGYLAYRKQGVSREDAIKGLESVLRDTWPKHTTKYPPQCDACDDLGFEEHICRLYARCQRVTCDRKGEQFQHRYVTFCLCAKGQAMERQTKTYPPPAEDAIGKVGKRQPSWKRLGA